MATAIMRGEDLNVIEIDGASNNRVEEARNLIANAGLSPTGNARYKVYIIDEVHMLSSGAFNALLKTMEEPPPHVKFILCTTEPQKVPATIQSRCQRFDFRNISAARIAEHLRDVLDREQVQAEDEVIWQIARLGNGSMRDALSLLDRLIATGQSPLTRQTLEEMFGLPDSQLILALIKAIADGDIKQTLEQTAGLLGKGISQDQLVEVLTEQLRQLMLIAACGAQSEVVELSEDVRPQMAQLAERFDAAALSFMVALCENLQRSGKNSATPRALLDACVVRLALAEKMADVTALLAGEKKK
jgi:DNA polymerase-3 subunit gamma/tau